MNDTGWDKIVDAIDTKFGIKEHGHYTEPLEDKPELEQKVRFICFDKGEQHYKLERVAHPAIIDRKTHYHKTAGGGVRYENIYDPTETSFKTKFYRQDSASEWQEIDPTELSI